MNDRFVESNGLRLHYLDHPGTQPTLVLMPGITANAHSFDGLIAAGLSPRFRVLALDLRGRGLSDQPEEGYSLADHAADVIGLLDALGLERVVLGGHSYGGLLTLHMAGRYHERIERVILLDAALGVANPRTYELIRPSIERLGKSYPSWDAYLSMMRSAPYFDGWWEPLIETYYRADVRDQPDGAVQPHTDLQTIAAVIAGMQDEDWAADAAAMRQPALLVRARGPYGPPDAPPIVSDEQVQVTCAALPSCHYVEVPGNHMTMLYGQGARQIVAAITTFLEET